MKEHSNLLKAPKSSFNTAISKIFYLEFMVSLNFSSKFSCPQNLSSSFSKMAYPCSFQNIANYALLGTLFERLVQAIFISLFKSLVADREQRNPS